MAALLGFSLLVTACGTGGDGNGPVLSDTPAQAGQLDLAGGVTTLDSLGINYHIGQPARVSASITGPTGQTYQLRQSDERSPGDYSLRLDGSVSLTESNLPQVRLLTNGAYRYALTAVADSGATAQASGTFQIVNSPADSAPPQIEDLSASPTAISPNFDARDDTSIIGWRTSRPATVTVSIAGANGFNRVVKTLKNQPAQTDKVVFNGLDEKGTPLTDGIYTYTVQAADGWGNVTRRAGQIEIKGGGTPAASIVQASIGPTSIIQGDMITVTLRVKNTGKVPIRSQGPYSGYVYNFNDVYSSIENGKYKDAAGFWRVGVDYESNSGGGPSRYPFRWGFGDELQPGQETEVIGLIKVDRPRRKA